MKKEAVLGFMIILIVVSTLTLAFNIQQVKAEPKIWTVDDDGPADFSTIQEAINAASQGDTIYVKAGTYYESVVVNKRVVLIGEDKNNTIIDGSGVDYVVTITVYNVSVSRFTIQNAWYGTDLRSSRNNITGNNINNNEIGIHCRGSGNNTIMGNSIDNNHFSFWLTDSSGNKIAKNTIKNNTVGILLSEISNNNIVSGNVINNTTYTSIALDGVYDRSPSGNIITKNTIKNEYRGIVLSNYCNRNIIAENNISSQVGILLSYYCNSNIIVENTLMRNSRGIELYYSGGNTISGNEATDNDFGIFLYSSSNNTIYHNSLIGNTVQVKTYYSTNNWDDGYPSGGNYWSNHVTVDDCCGVNQDELGSDGIVDEPYIIDDFNCDNYPLTEPWTSLPPIPTTLYELKAEIEELGSDDEIDNQGIVKSLLAKLNVAQKLVDKGKVDQAVLIGLGCLLLLLLCGFLIISELA